MNSGVAYFGTHDDRHYTSDLREIAAARFRWVNIPVTEERARFDAAGIAAEVAAARAAGLEVWLSPWGVAGRFGGEGLSVVSSGCEPWATLTLWLDATLAARPDAIMWDEPRDLDAALFAHLRREVAASGMRNALILEPEKPWPDATTLTDVDYLGTDPYDWYRPDWCDWAGYWVVRAQVLAAQIGAEPHAWVRACRVNAGEEERIAAATRLHTSLGVERIGYWAAFGSRSVGCLACANPDATWAATCASVRE